MKRKPAQPRTARYFGMASPPLMLGLGTWLESEEITYPRGSMIRRARAFNTDTGRLMVVRCGIADTFFSVPVRGGGFLATSHGNVLLYHPPKRHSPQKGTDQS